MVGECSVDFARFGKILAQLGPVRRAGHGLQFRCLFPDRHKHGDRNWSAFAWITPRGNLVAGCYGCGAKWREFVLATGTLSLDWFPHNKQSRDRMRRENVVSKLVARYRYCRPDGTLAYEKERWEPGFAGSGKSCRFRRSFPNHLRAAARIPAGIEAWVYGITAGEYGRRQTERDWSFHPFKQEVHQQSLVITGEDPILYRLPELLSADPRHPVFVVEGEKDVEMLRDLGFLATCGPYGSSTWLDDWAKHLSQRRVVVVPDNDRVGYDHADRVAGSVIRNGAASLRMVTWDDEMYNPGKGGGVGNWLPKVNPTGDRKIGYRAVVDLCQRSSEYAR